MTIFWSDFLVKLGAKTDAEGWTSFPHAETSDDCLLVNLSMLGLIEAEGDDSVTFLQGQLTNDTRNVTPTRSILASYCNPKGRMLANFRLFSLRQNHLLLQSPLGLIPSTLKRLSMFIMRSNVRLSDASEEYARLGLIGDQSGTVLKKLGYTLPTASNDSQLSENVLITRMPGATSRYELLCPVEQANDLWTALSSSATPGDSREWARQDILAGEPNVYPSTTEAFVPQMTNLHLIDGISFTKGCYTGQEVVARMQYLGKLKRRMYLAHIDSEAKPSPGDELFSAQSASGQGAGRVVDAQPCPEGGFDLLAVVEIKGVKGNDVHLGDLQGPRLAFSNLPYSFDIEESH